MKKSCFSVGAIVFVIFAVTVLVGAVLFTVIYFPATSKQLFGEPAGELSVYQKLIYPIRLVLGQHLLLDGQESTGTDQAFTIQQGETVDEIAGSLQSKGLIDDAELFRIYLIYSGLDRSIQAGDYLISPTSSPYEIARMLQDATPKFVHFIILPGWRLEEIAGSLETSGLAISKEEFISFLNNHSPSEFEPLLQDVTGFEGFLFPGDYLLPRDTQMADLTKSFLEQFTTSVTTDLLDAYTARGLTLRQAVILASIIQREAVHEDEMPLIASVFINRLAAGMKFDSDATVQYALGYDSTKATWWKSPLTLDDLAIDSPYNTYLISGFPPSPICNPGLAALKAVAFPSESPFYYFRARCDHSGYHNFAETFAQQEQNACP